MQGIQSSIVPEKMEKRGLTSATAGTFEAAKRYLDRQRASEAALAAMEDDEAQTTSQTGDQLEDGRPAWLKRWQGEALPRIAQARSAADRISPTDTQESDQNAPVNGYTGQSIEAAFAFETSFHFETELEAEETEDWLDLSGEREQTGASGPVLFDTSDNPDSAAESPSASREASRSTERLSATGAVPDPQAVRAAIFRLAQESTHRWVPAQKPAETTASSSELSRKILLPNENTDGNATGSGSPRAEFAEVARQVWSAHFSDAEGNPTIEEPASSEGLESARGYAESPQERPTKDLAMHRQGDQGLFLTNALPPSLAPVVEERVTEVSTAAQETAHSQAETEPAEAKPEPEWTLNQALSQIRSEIRGELQNEARSEAAEAGSAKVGSQPEGVPSSAAPKPSDPQGMASDAPALAHDASNLLSALKLYSELLALSGVLQARHSHYAQDLKLLAARSEVLIDRLLASCTLAESDARQLVRSHGLEAIYSPLPETAGPAGAEISATSTEMSNDSRHPSQTTEPTQNRPDNFAVEAPEASKGCEAKGPPLGSALSQGLAKGFEQPFAAQDETDVAEDRSIAAQELDQAGTAQRAEAEPAQTSTSDVDAEGNGRSESINLVDLLTRWGSLLSMIARGPVEVKFGPQAALPIQVGEEAMERILVNLVHNAMTATRNGGAIRIGVGRSETRRAAHSHPPSEGRARPEGRMVLTVDDSGCGMSEQQIAKVLGMGGDPQSDRGGALEEGRPNGGSPRRHGMGLQIVRELVAASGGELAIYSRSGVGTRIEIQWPTLREGTFRQDTLRQNVEQGQRRPVQSADSGAGAPGGFTYDRIRQGLGGAIAC
jgi:hypothetical protein